jgi:hypothetical protein
VLGVFYLTSLYDFDIRFWVHIFKKIIGFGASVTVEQLLITVGMLTSLFVSQAVWKYLHATLFSRWLVCFDGLSNR